MISFDDFFDELRAKAEQEGPAAVAEFEALESHYREYAGILEGLRAVARRDPRTRDSADVRPGGLMGEDTFAGDAEREPMLVSELLEDLGVAHHDISDQILAVLEWWQHHGESARPMLRVAVERWLKDPNGQLGLWPPRPGSMDGEEFARSLGFDDIGDKIAEIKRRRGD